MSGGRHAAPSDENGSAANREPQHALLYSLGCRSIRWVVDAGQVLPLEAGWSRKVVQEAALALVSTRTQAGGRGAGRQAVRIKLQAVPSSAGKDDHPVVATPSKAPSFLRHGWVEGSANLGWAFLLMAVAFGLIAGTVTFATGFGGEQGTWPGPDYEPPLFFVLANGLYAVAIVLSLPSLVSAISASASRNWRSALHGYHRFLAPVVVYLGFFEGSHLIGCSGVGTLCTSNEFTGRAHLLHHTIVGALPLALLLSATLYLVRGRSRSSSSA